MTDNFSAADMATAAADGFRAGHHSEDKLDMVTLRPTRREAHEARWPNHGPQAASIAQKPTAWHEQAIAIREGSEIAASDEYFAARPQIVSADRRKVFRAGFERGWDAARAAQEGKA